MYSYRYWITWKRGLLFRKVGTRRNLGGFSEANKYYSTARPPLTSTFANVKNPNLRMNGSPGKGAPTMPPVDEEDDLPP